MEITDNDPLGTIKFSSDNLIGDYIIGNPLGDGAYSTTFKGVNQTTRDVVAIKVFVKSSSLSSKLYDDEINAYQTLQGLPGILQLKDYGENNNFYYIVTEFIQQGSLRYILKNHPKGMDITDTIQLFTPIAHAIDNIHGKNIIHRDLKPENILCRKSAKGYEIFVTDFGVVKFTADSQQFQTGHTAGTSWYIAPEAWNADPNIPQTKAVDIYALGVMLYETLEGKMPFSHPTGVIESEARFPEQTNRKANIEVVDLVLRSLSKDSAERPTSAIEFIDGIRNAYEQNLDMDRRWVGKKIGNYIVEEVLGAGRMGTSLRARDIETNHLVVLKGFRYSLSGIAMQAYDKEKKSLDRLENGHGVLVPQDGFEHSSVSFIVTEYQSGGNLRNLLNRRPRLEISEILEIFAQIAESIDYIHEKKIVHRDIKPENIVYNRNDGKITTFITDFGVSVLLANTQTSFKTRGIGTPQYMAPEVWEGNAKGSKAVDIYAFGIMLFEALEGHAPFKAEDIDSFRKQHIQGSVQAPERTLKELGENAKNVILQSLAKDPEERPRTASEIIQQISGQHAMFLGKKYGNYVIEKFIGRGTYGATYRAFDKNKNQKKKFAFKILSIPEPLMNEVDALKKLGNHEGILPIREGKSENGIHYIITDYLNGNSLREMLQSLRQEMNLDEALKLFKPIAKALDYLHDNGLVHGDLIPSNVILIKNRNEVNSLRPVITGFGISKIAGKVQPFHSKSNWNYIAPELWRNGEPSPASDLYAFGVMLFEALEGTTPFNGTSVAEIMERHLDDNPPTPKNLLNLHGKEAVKILFQFLDKKVERRPKSATELVSQLGEIVQNGTPIYTGPISGQLGRAIKLIISASKKKVELSMFHLVGLTMALIVILGAAFSLSLSPVPPPLTPSQTIDWTQIPTTIVPTTETTLPPTASTPNLTTTPTSPTSLGQCRPQYPIPQEGCIYTADDTISVEQIYETFYEQLLGSTKTRYDEVAIAYYNNRKAQEETEYDMIDFEIFNVQKGSAIFLPHPTMIKEYREFPRPVLEVIDTGSTSSTITISGSSALYPLTLKIKEGIENITEYEVNIKANNTKQGLSDFCRGRAEVFSASEERLQDCPQVTFKKFEIARYAVVIYINDRNPYKEELDERPLNVQELLKLLTSATSWNDVREELDPDGESIINRYYPSHDSGAFEIVKNTIFPNLDSGSITNLSNIEDEHSIPHLVKGDIYSIGFSGNVDYQESRDSLIPIPVNGVLPNRDTIEGENPAYPLARQLYLYTGKDTYNSNPLIRFFINYYLSYELDHLDRLGYFYPNKSRFLYNLIGNPIR